MQAGLKFLRVALVGGSLSLGHPAQAADIPAWCTRTRGNADTSGEFAVVGATGASYVLERGTKLTFTPGSAFGLGKPLKLMLDNGHVTRVPSVRLARGRVDVVVPETDAAVILRGPLGTATLFKGGAGIFSAEETMVTTAAVDHEAMVSIGRGWEKLQASMGTTVTKWNRVLSPRPLLTQAPELRHSSTFVFLMGDQDRAKISLEWSALRYAAHYEAILEEVRQHSSPRKVVLDGSQVSFDGLGPGGYQVRIRGLDLGGIEGPFSEPVPVKVLGLQLPAAAYVATDGTILLPPFDTLELLASEGLEVSYGDTNHFLPAPRFLSPGRNRASRVVLRDPSSGQQGELRLEPLKIRADIHFKAPGGRWPKTGLPIEVHLMTPTGRPVPRSFEVETLVSANVVPLRTTWQRTSPHVLTTVLPRPGAQESSVVRVDVLDAHGTSIGYDFVELLAP